MDNKLIKCIKIIVDCVKNDPVDIRCGGPQFLGFDFNVKEEELKEIMLFVVVALILFDIPIININIEKETIEISEEKVWTKERILECIRNDAEYLIEEAARDYETYPKR